jgi:hypothetical protein
MATLFTLCLLPIYFPFTRVVIYNLCYIPSLRNLAKISAVPSIGSSLSSWQIGKGAARLLVALPSAFSHLVDRRISSKKQGRLQAISMLNQSLCVQPKHSFLSRQKGANPPTTRAATAVAATAEAAAAEAAAAEAAAAEAAAAEAAAAAAAAAVAEFFICIRQLFVIANFHSLSRVLISKGHM